MQSKDLQKADAEWGRRNGHGTGKAKTAKKAAGSGCYFDCAGGSDACAAVSSAGRGTNLYDGFVCFLFAEGKVQLCFVRKDRPTAFVIKTNTPPGERQFLPADRAGYFVFWGFSPAGREVSGVF